MNDPALEIQRYNFGLMMPDEQAAFEDAISNSSDLQKEFQKSGDALYGMYVSLSEGMPTPGKEIKEILLAKISEKERDRATFLAGGILAASIAMIPSEIPDASPISTGGNSPSLSGKVTTPLIVAAVVLSLIGINIFSSSEKPNALITLTAQTHSDGIIKPVEIRPSMLALDNKVQADSQSTSVILNLNEVTKSPQLPEINAENNRTTVERHSAVSQIPGITFKDPISPKQNTNIANHHNEIVGVNDELYSEVSWSEKISFSISHTSTLKFYPGRLDMAPVPSMNNWGTALRYAISSFVGIGIEGGRETFPFYREKSNDTYDEFYSVTWAGASVTIADPRLEIFDCYPEARAAAGFSTAGPIGKISVGFTWQPSNIVTFSPELEWTGVYIKNTGVFIIGKDVSAGGKLGFSISTSFHF
jgi:hypothetical protein